MKIAKRILIYGALLIVLTVTVWIGLLALPSPLFDYNKQFGAITAHSDRPFDAELDSIVTDGLARLEAIEIFDPDRMIDLYLCHTQDQFSLFTKLSRQPPGIMGFNLSQLSNCYINFEGIYRLGRESNFQPMYASREGSVSHIIAHELTHQFMVDRLSYSVNRSLPTWKTEGYCEYASNFAKTRRDGVSLTARLDVYKDETVWNKIAATHREHYLSGLLVEYLVTRKGLSLEEIAEESITKDQAFNWMIQGLSEDKAIVYSPE